MKRLTITALACALAGASLTGCAASPANQGSFVVIDSALRSLGADCAGSGTHLPFHNGATLAILDEEGAEVSATKLAPGTAIAADTKNYGNAERVPSYCAFDFDASKLVAGKSYDYTIDGEPAGSFVHGVKDDAPAPIAHPALGDPSSVLNGAPE